MRINITLGHNASAALFGQGNICIRAYEEERLTKVKSDSSFPKLAIERCLGDNPASSINEIAISDWFNKSKQEQENKYNNPKYLQKRFKNAKITNLSHHDAHANSVWNFSETTNGLTVVIDGFGNNEEVISIYRDGKLIDKISGYENSLGLMYQYATSAAGLKENEDEFKLLGYEIHSTISKRVIDMPTNIQYRDDDKELINFTKLRYVREYWHRTFKDYDVCDIARLVQYTIEERVIDIINKYYDGDELIQLSGGVFYNVKLNNKIMREMPGRCKLIVNPVCGDQGNVFGVSGCRYNNLYLGQRDIVEHMPSDSYITDIFCGAMEFGPRALCHTSTLALPTKQNVDLINLYNNRDTVMPMAPVVTREFFNENFKDTNKVINSEKYMIVSFDYKSMRDEWLGAAHYDPDRDVYTGRVQVLDRDDMLYDYVDNKGGMLINTSLNAHGTPILFDNEDYFLYKNK